MKRKHDYFKVILHQLWVKNIFPWKFNLEYGGTFTKLFMHVPLPNMFPTTRNLQIRVHVYRPRHYCGDWLTFGCFVPMIADYNFVKKSFGPMIADHDLMKKRQTIMDVEVSTHSWQWLLRNLSVSCRVKHFLFCNYSYVVHTEYIYFFHQLNIAHER